MSSQDKQPEYVSSRTGRRVRQQRNSAFQDEKHAEFQVSASSNEDTDQQSSQHRDSKSPWWTTGKAAEANFKIPEDESDSHSHGGARSSAGRVIPPRRSSVVTGGEVSDDNISMERPNTDSESNMSMEKPHGGGANPVTVPWKSRPASKKKKTRRDAKKDKEKKGSAEKRSGSQSSYYYMTEDEPDPGHNTYTDFVGTYQNRNPNMPKKLVNDSWYRQLLCLPTENLLAMYPPLARAYVQMDWYEQNCPTEFQNPYDYNWIPQKAPVKGNQDGLELPPRVDAEGQVEFQDHTGEDNMNVIDEDPLAAMLPKPEIRDEHAGFFTQVISLILKDLLIAKENWILYLFGWVAIAAAWFVPAITFKANSSLKTIYASASGYDLTASDQVQYAWAASGIWQTLCLGFPVIMASRALIYEKHSGARDSLTVSKLRGSAYYFALFIETIITAIVSGIIALVSFIALLSDVKSNDTGTSSTTLALYYGAAAFFMHLSYVFFGVAISTLFKQAWGYKIVMVIYSLNFFPFVAYVPNVELDLDQGWLFLPAQYILEVYKTISAPKGSINPFSGQLLSPTLDDYPLWIGLSAAYGLGIWFVYMYFNEVLKHMDPRPWYFLFSPTYWGGISSSDLNEPEQLGHQHPWYLQQEVNQHLIDLARAYKCVSVVGVNATRTTKGRTKHVLKNVSFTMYEGEIFVLMGQKESGKTTLLNAIGGLEPPDSGEFSVYGQVQHGIPKDFGCCPQSDVLWGGLTARQHINLYAKVKGIDMNDEDIYKLLDEVRIAHDIDRKAELMSHTDKRRLCIAIAFIGDPKFVMLDAPTKGMDTFARREIWTFLQKKKHDRVIMVSTDTVDEAEVLADRAAVLACGELAACGSRDFLAEMFSCGYVITAVAHGNTKDSVTAALRYLAQECGIVLDRTQIYTNESYVSSLSGYSGGSSGHQSSFDSSSVTGGTPSVDRSSNIENVVSRDAVSSNSSSQGSHENALHSNNGSEQTDRSNALHSNNADSTHNHRSPAARSTATGVSREQRLSDREDAMSSARRGSAASSAAAHALQADDMKLLGHGDNQSNATSLISSTAKHATLRLPFSVRDRLPMVVRSLEAWKVQKRIKSYAVSVASLRDAFLHASRLGTFELEMVHEPNEDEEDPQAIDLTPDIKSLGRFAHLKPMLRRRLMLAWSNKPVFWFTVLGPSIMFLVAYGVWRALLKSWTPNSQKFLPTTAGVVAGITVNIGFMLLGLFSVDFLVKERALKIKEQLYMTGCSKTSYWLANGFYDFCLAAIPAIVITIVKFAFPSDWFLSNVTISEWLPMMLGIYAVGHAVMCMLISLVTSQRYVAAILMVVINAYASFLFALFVCLYGISDNNDLFYSFQVLGWVLGTLSPLYPVMVYVLYPGFQQQASMEVSLEIIKICINDKGGCQNAGVNGWWAAPAVFDIYPPLINFGYSVETAKASVAETFSQQLAKNEDAWKQTLLWDDTAVVPSNSFRQFIADAGDGLQNDEKVINILHTSGSRLVAGDQVVRLCLIILIYLALAIAIEAIRNSYWWKAKCAPKDEVPEEAMGPADGCVCRENKRVDEICDHIMHEMERKENSPHISSHDRLHPDENASHSSSRRSSCCSHTSHTRPDGTATWQQPDPGRLFPPVFCKDLRRSHKAGDEIFSSGDDGDEIVHALRGITLATEAGEIFGMLGEEGSGKTTAMDLMAGVTMPSGGQLRVTGYDYADAWFESRPAVGYIPEDDRLWDELTVTQHLKIYGELRGLRSWALMNAIQHQITMLQLEQYRDEKVCFLPIGARRKLSWGIAMIGDPQIIFCDQPTTGMDPLTRRFMIGLMRRMAAKRDDGCFVIATDLMEEASVLCDRVALLVDGTFRCLESPENMLELHGQGFELNVDYMPPPESESSFLGDNRDKIAMWNIKMSLKLERLLQEILGDCIVRAETDSLKATWIFHADGDVLGDAFEAMEIIREECNVATFNISQVTLDRVFHYFALQRTGFDDD